MNPVFLANVSSCQFAATCKCLLNPKSHLGSPTERALANGFLRQKASSWMTGTLRHPPKQTCCTGVVGGSEEHFSNLLTRYLPLCVHTLKIFHTWTHVNNIIYIYIYFLHTPKGASYARVGCQKKKHAPDPVWDLCRFPWYKFLRLWNSLLYSTLLCPQTKYFRWANLNIEPAWLHLFESVIYLTEVIHVWPTSLTVPKVLPPVPSHVTLVCQDSPMSKISFTRSSLATSRAVLSLENGWFPRHPKTSGGGIYKEPQVNTWFVPSFAKVFGWIGIIESRSRSIHNMQRLQERGRAPQTYSCLNKKIVD